MSHPEDQSTQCAPELTAEELTAEQWLILLFASGSHPVSAAEALL